MLQKAVDDITAEESVPQLDGPDKLDNSASANSSTSSSDSMSADDEEESDTGNELNSDDDISDESSEVLEVDNTILCQYERVMRRSNKWRFVLKNGIIKVDGQEYIFSKMYGSTEW